jgi:hypothetical protein
METRANNIRRNEMKKSVMFGLTALIIVVASVGVVQAQSKDKKNVIHVAAEKTTFSQSPAAGVSMAVLWGDPSLKPEGLGKHQGYIRLACHACGVQYDRREVEEYTHPTAMCTYRDSFVPKDTWARVVESGSRSKLRREHSNKPTSYSVPIQAPVVCLARVAGANFRLSLRLSRKGVHALFPPLASRLAYYARVRL